jgi:hypothetical protein
MLCAIRHFSSWATRVLSQLEDTELCWENFGTPSRLERDGVEALYERRMAAAWVGFAGANISAPRKWFLEDGFDESTGTRWGLEDISLAVGWTLAGKALMVAAGAGGLHLQQRRGYLLTSQDALKSRTWKTHCKSPSTPARGPRPHLSKLPKWRSP